ncbi:MAG TPA: 50S ribosomal protein L30 [Candidatus Onthoplasma faecipullorum]|nr:50S ribosomal protein L30 [Candidatus Onthoplasma faecipullorum]
MAKKQVKTIKVTLVKSPTGYDKRQAKIVEALGFKKLGQTRVLPDNDCIRGSIFKVNHLLKVEEEA